MEGWRQLMNSRLLFLILVAFAINVRSATWYSAAWGSSTNGTRSSPWSVPYATTTNAAFGNNPHIAAGDTIIFLTGEFTCTDTNAGNITGRCLNFKYSGTPGNQIIYKSESLWGAGFDGTLFLDNQGGGASNVMLHGLRVWNSMATNRVATNGTTLAYTFGGGINEFTEGNSIHHNLFINCGHPGIGSWKTTRGKDIRGNVIMFSGIYDFTFGAGYNGGARGSGMYLQNATNSSRALVEGNISIFNHTTGSKAYGNTDIWGFRFARNFDALNNEAGIFFHQDTYGSTNFAAVSNMTFRNATGIKVGYQLGNSGHSNAIVERNYMVEDGNPNFPFVLLDGWRNVSFSNNTLVAISNRYLAYWEITGETNAAMDSHHMGGNYYFATNTGGYGNWNFSITNNSFLFSAWTNAVGTDADATFAYNMPQSNTNWVLRPSSDTNIVNVICYNWTGASSESIDLSSYFATYQRLQIFDAQNVPTTTNNTAFTNFIYSGGSISLPLTLTNRAEMLGVFTNRSEVWTGMDTRARAFVVQALGIEASITPTPARFNSSSRHNPSRRR